MSKTKTTPLSEKVESFLSTHPDLGVDAQVLQITADGMPKFQIDNATQEITAHRIIREVLKWVEGTHVPNITWRRDRHAG